MKVLHLNTLEAGGAAKAALRLHGAMKGLGFDSRFLALTRSSSDPEVMAFQKREVFAEWRGKVLRKARALLPMGAPDPNYAFADFEASRVRSPEAVFERIGFVPDAIVAHWISGFLNVRDLQALSRASGAPVLWYLLDMAPMTGGCHYAWDCRGYLKQCGRCPAIRSKNPDDRSHRAWKLKRQTLERTDVVIVAGSEWNYRQALQASAFAGKRIEKVPVSVDPALFSPGEAGAQREARQALGLPTEGKVVFFGAQSLDERRKGISILLEALAHYRSSARAKAGETVTFVSAGWSRDSGLPLQIGLNYIHLGVLEGDEKLRQAYRAADLFVCPSIEDSGPMMINESVMSGTPVLSFEMGAALDFVLPGKTGYRAKLADAQDLARGLALLLGMSPEEQETMAANCRELALRLSHPRVQAEAFQRIIQEELVNRANRRTL